MDAAEVRIKLVVDGAAKEAAKGTEEALKGTAEAAHHANEALKEGGESASGFSAAGNVGMAGMAAAAAVAAAAFAGLAAVSHEAFEAAVAEQEQVKKLGNSILMSGVNDIEQAHGLAEGMNHELKEMAIHANVSAEAVSEAFSSISARSNKGVVAIQKLTEEMALAGRAVPGGIGALSQGFSQMEMGIVRARNPVVQLIAATGTLHGNAKAVAAQMMKMTPDKQMALGEAAIEKMAQKAKNMPATFKELEQSMKDIKDTVLEEMGKPILDAIHNIMQGAKDFFYAHEEQIESTAAAVGERVSEFISFVKDIFSGFVSEFNSADGSLSTSIGDTMTDAREMWDSIRDDGMAIGRTLKDIADAVVMVIHGAEAATRGTIMILTAGLSEVAMRAMGKADMFGNKTRNSQEDGEMPSRVTGQLRRANEAFMDLGSDPSHLEEAKRHFEEAAAAAGMSGAKVREYVEGMEAARERAYEANPLTKDFKDAERETHDYTPKDASGNELPTISADMQAANADWIKTYQAAASEHNEAAMKAGAAILMGSEKLQKELIESGAIADGAITGLSNRLTGALAGLVLNQEKKAADSMRAKGSNLYMMGGQTFNMRQDFRDQSPDNVAIVFRRDIVKSAVNRGQARLAGAFGN